MRLSTFAPERSFFAALSTPLLSYFVLFRPPMLLTSSVDRESMSRGTATQKKVRPDSIRVVEHPLWWSNHRSRTAPSVITRIYKNSFSHLHIKQLPEVKRKKKQKRLFGKYWVAERVEELLFFFLMKYCRANKCRATSGPRNSERSSEIGRLEPWDLLWIYLPFYFQERVCLTAHQLHRTITSHTTVT